MQRIKSIETRKFYIYVLKDPTTLEVRYVGVTCTSILRRLHQHMYDARGRGTHKRNWLNTLRENNLRPIVETIEECSYMNYQEREVYWISYYDNLTNTDKGGNGVVTNRSSDSIKRSSEAKFQPIVSIDSDRNVCYYKSHKEAVLLTGVPRTSIEYSLSSLNYSSYGYNFIKTSEYTVDMRLKVKINPKRHKYKITHNNIDYTPKEFSLLLQASETTVYLWCEGKFLWEESKYYDGSDVVITKI